MNPERIKEIENFSNELKQESVILADTKWMKDISKTLFDAGKIINELLYECKTSDKAFNDMLSHSIEKGKKDTENLEKLFSITHMYKILLGEDVANLVEQSAKRLWNKSKKEEDKK